MHLTQNWMKARISSSSVLRQDRNVAEPLIFAIPPTPPMSPSPFRPSPAPPTPDGDMPVSNAPEGCVMEHRTCITDGGERGKNSQPGSGRPTWTSSTCARELLEYSTVHSRDWKDF